MHLYHLTYRIAFPQMINHVELATYITHVVSVSLFYPTVKYTRTNKANSLHNEATAPGSSLLT